MSAETSDPKTTTARPYTWMHTHAAVMLVMALVGEPCSFLSIQALDVSLSLLTPKFSSFIFTHCALFGCDALFAHVAKLQFSVPANAEWWYKVGGRRG